MAQCVEDGDLQCKVPSLLWAEQVGIEGVEGEVEDDVGENEEPKEEVADGYLPKLYAAFRRILLHDGQSDNGSQGPAKKDFLFRLSRAWRLRKEPFLADVMNACLTKKAGGVSCPISYM
jgi:hypothetical protein